MSRRTGSARRALAALLAALALLAAPRAEAAGETSVTALADRTELTRDDLLHVTIRFEGRTMPSRLDPPPGDFDFEIVGRSQSQQTFVSFGAGGVQQQHAVQWDLTLAPRRDGALSVPPFAIAVGGERLQTQPIPVKVLPSGRAPRAPPAVRAPANAPSAGWHGWERDLWLEVQVDRREPWLGEQVTASVYLVSPVGVTGIEGFKPPAYDGFWAESLEVPRPIEPTLRVVRGIPLRSFLIQRIALFPTRAGKLTIEPFQIDATVQVLSGNRLFDPFRSVQQVRRRSAPVELTVKPLPAGAPPGFDAVNVGALTLELLPSERTIPAGEPVALRLSARGQGNVRAWSLPTLPPIAGTRRYEPTSSEEVKADRGRISGRRTLETLLVPERPGELVIPPLAWPWFDTRAGRYAVARTAVLRIQVGAGAGMPAPAARALAEGLRPIRADGALTRAGRPPWSGATLPLLFLLPPAGFAALVLHGRIRERTRLDAPARRVRGAVRTARRRLSAAERRLRAGDGAGFVAELERALTGYAGDRLGRPVAGLTRGALSAALAQAGAHPPAVGAFVAALDGCDAARFGGATAGAALLDAAAEAMALLEESDGASGAGGRA
jgi:hypothetical protein